jgi:putative mRNA 3-end processing factor
LQVAKMNGLVETTPSGLYCRQGDFYIDPWRPVQRAVITHAHGDHARQGSAAYLACAEGASVLKARLGDQIRLQALAYGEKLSLGRVQISLHPAGHILGSSQVRIEAGGRICVVSGDYKVEEDPTCEPMELLRCHQFITESTFGLPIFRFPSQQQVLDDIGAWWQSNRDSSRTSVLFAYALGKAQRVIAGLDPSIGPILTHGAVEKINACYRQAGVRLPATRTVGSVENKKDFRGAIVIAPPSADHPAWLRKFAEPSRAVASGWMQIRGNRRRRSLDRGFILSDHSDWQGLNQAIAAAEADTVGVTHGYAAEMVRWLTEIGRQAYAMRTSFGAGTDAESDESPNRT